MFKKTAWLFLKAFIFSIVLAIVFDLFVIMLFYEDMRTQIYMAGHYVETMAADPEALARGETDQTKLFKDEDIEKEFGKFVHATYSNMSGGAISGSKRSYVIDMGGEKRINKIEANINIITHGGVKGTDVNLVYVLKPFTAVFFEGEGQGFRISMTRRFRIVGG